MDRSSAGTNVSEAESGELSWRSLADPPRVRFGFRSQDLWRPVLIFAACRLTILLGIVGLASVSAGLGLRPRFVHSAFPLVAAGGVELRSAWFVLAALSLASQVALAYFSVTSTRAIP